MWSCSSRELMVESRWGASTLVPSSTGAVHPTFPFISDCPANTAISSVVFSHWSLVTCVPYHVSLVIAITLHSFCTNTLTLWWLKTKCKTMLYSLFLGSQLEDTSSCCCSEVNHGQCQCDVPHFQCQPRRFSYCQSLLFPLHWLIGASTEGLQG